MKRRTFLKNTAAASLPLLMGGFPIQAIARNHALARAMSCETDRVLVLIQLNGGNDGLNTLIPLDQYSILSSARSNVLIPANKTLSLTTETALHPAMTGFKNLYDDEKMSIVQGAGYPDPNFSHFRSTDIWTTASASNEKLSTGWIGRYLETEHPAYPAGYPNTDFPDPLAITIGSIVSTTCQGPVANASLAISSLEAFDQLLTGGTAPAPNTPYGTELTFLRQSMAQTNEYLAAVQAAAQLGSNQSSLYPATGQNRLADQLKIVAQLISGGLKTPFYIVNQGGYDTHANQVDGSDPAIGSHATLLGQLSEAVMAFQDDLDKQQLDDRVVGMTYSEFGRRIVSNFSLGTDHGAAAPLFVFGTHANPMIHGQSPSLPTNPGPQDNLPMQFDFRSVYGSILMDWFCVDELLVKDLLYEDFQYIPVLKDTNVALDAMVDSSLVSLEQNFPNPFQNQTLIRFETPAARVKITLFNNEGKEIRVIFEREVTAGKHEFMLDVSDLAAGIYHCRLQCKDQVRTKMMVLSK